ncbi:MAG TPA: Crp/Fnr family transcriptional regulator [Burkholderiaceae bacterium]|nr:Crp/Fnr family transcriptional regulator [Burkholderiaceae bacterium]
MSVDVAAADHDANLLLAALSDTDRQRLVPHLRALDLPGGEVLQRAGDIVVDTWFPCGAALASFTIDSGAGQGVEVAIIGRDGAIGGIVSNGSLPAYATATVRGAGRFLCIRTVALEQAKLESIHLRHWFARYADCLLAQVFQTAACNATHTIAQRASRWLLSAAERTGRADLAMTQEDLAGMLGVGRSFMTRVFGELRRAGVVETGRGRIRIADRAALRRTACDCSTLVENHFHQVLGGIYD